MFQELKSHYLKKIGEKKNQHHSKKNKTTTLTRMYKYDTDESDRQREWFGTKKGTVLNARACRYDDNSILDLPLKKLLLFVGDVFRSHFSTKDISPHFLIKNPLYSDQLFLLTFDGRGRGIHDQVFPLEDFHFGLYPQSEVDHDLKYSEKHLFGLESEKEQITTSESPVQTPINEDKEEEEDDEPVHIPEEFVVEREEEPPILCNGSTKRKQEEEEDNYYFKSEEQQKEIIELPFDFNTRQEIYNIMDSSALAQERRFEEMESMNPLVREKRRETQQFTIPNNNNNHQSSTPSPNLSGVRAHHIPSNNYKTPTSYLRPMPSDAPKLITPSILENITYLNGSYAFGSKISHVTEKEWSRQSRIGLISEITASVDCNLHLLFESISDYNPLTKKKVQDKIPQKYDGFLFLNCTCQSINTMRKAKDIVKKLATCISHVIGNPEIYGNSFVFEITQDNIIEIKLCGRSYRLMVHCNISNQYVIAVDPFTLCLVDNIYQLKDYQHFKVFSNRLVHQAAHVPFNQF